MSGRQIAPWMRRFFGAIFLLLVGALAPITLEAADTNATVRAVIDGDTLMVHIDGTTEHLRLIGIDAPESRENPRAMLQAERSQRDLATVLAAGRRAEHFLRSLLPAGSPVRIEYDVERRDRYRRLLAYVYTEDGTMVNERLLAEGLVRLYTVPPNVRHVKRLTRAQSSQAKSSR